MDGIRINKYLSEHGICSRREADRLLEEGRILINGKKAEMGQRVQDTDLVSIDQKKIEQGEKDEAVVLAFHKPRGIVCSTTSQDRSQNIIDYINYKDRVFPIGRLDKDSNGLILLTNRGELVNAINKAKNGHEKEYLVRCKDKISDAFIEKMRNGVEISVPARDTDPLSGKRNYKKVRTAKCFVSRVDERSFDIILTQGLNRQIRRMCEALGNSVTELKRIRIMNIHLGDLKEGKYRIVKAGELKQLEDMLDLK